MSTGSPMRFTQSEATAAQRTWVFHLTLTADGADATGKTLSGADVRIGKAGAALANAVGVVTELASGWYKLVFDAGDLDTLGALEVDISESLCDDVHVVHQVVLQDENVASYLDAAGLQTDAVTEIQNGLATAAAVAALARGQRTVNVQETNLSTNVARSRSMENAIDTVITLNGTWDSATVTIQTCENPAATVPLWTTVASGAKTADAVVTITGPHSAWRAIMSSAGASSNVQVSSLTRYAN